MKVPSPVWADVNDHGTTMLHLDKSALQTTVVDTLVRRKECAAIAEDLLPCYADGTDADFLQRGSGVMPKENRVEG